MSGGGITGEAVSRTARSYGGSLYELAACEGASQVIMEDMGLVWQSFKESPPYRRLLQEPSIPLEKRLAFIEEAFGGQIHTYLLNFLMLLCEKNLLPELGGCFREYRRHFCEENDVVRAVVTSATPLTKGQTAELTGRLEAMTGKRVVLRPQVDEQVLGGLRVELVGKRLDGTMEGGLRGLERSIISGR